MNLSSSDQTKLITYSKYLIKWIKQQVVASGLSGIVLGLSGGVDSALVAALTKRAIDKQLNTVFLDCYSPVIDFKLAAQQAQKFKLKFTNYSLNKEYDQMVTKFAINDKIAQGNIKARLRMIALYALANQEKLLVIGTDNAAEWYTGYFTKYGDGGVDIAPLIHLNKSQIYFLAKYYQVMDEIIQRVPTASLFTDQFDEVEMDVTYKQIDNYLLGKQIKQDAFDKIEKLHNNTKHKRVGIIVPKKY